MHRIATLVAAATLLPTSAWASCAGLAGQAQLDCLQDRLAETTSIVRGLVTQLQTTQADLATTQADLATTQADLATTQADLADAEARLATVEGAHLTAADVDAYALATDLDAYALATDLDTARWDASADLVDDWASYLSVDTSAHEVVFTGANVYVQSGSGSTSGPVDGTGNLIVGYDEGTASKTGSHNLVVGAQHGYTSYGGLVAGYDNEVSAPWATVAGGEGNAASADHAAILGGQNGSAADTWATVTGGFSNVSGGTWSVAVGGYDNAVYESDSVVVGGTYNTVVDGASGYSNVLLGGFQATLDGGLFYSVLSYGSNSTMSTNGHSY